MQYIQSFCQGFLLSEAADDHQCNKCHVGTCMWQAVWTILASGKPSQSALVSATCPG